MGRRRGKRKKLVTEQKEGNSVTHPTSDEEANPQKPNNPPSTRAPNPTGNYSECPCQCAKGQQKSFFDKATLIILLLTSLATAAAAGFTGRQAKISQEVAKKQLRPYLSMSVKPNAVQNVQEGGMAHVEAVLENFGATPAYRAAWASGINVSENTPSFRVAYRDCDTIANQPEAGEWTIGKQAVYPNKDRTTPFTKKEIADMQSGKAVIYFHGRICYRDVFDDVYPEDFCIYWDWDKPKSRLHVEGKFCQHGNGPPGKDGTF